MRYSDDFKIGSTLGSTGSYVFRANSVYDPDYTGVGHQPMGYDVWAGQYTHYIVEQSRVTFKLMPGSVLIEGFKTGVFLSPSFVPPYSDPSGYIEAGKGTVSYATGRQVAPLTISSKFDTRKFFNITDVKDNLDNLGATTVLNPQELAYFIIWFSSNNNTTFTCSVQVTIDYIVSFSEPLALPQS
jgi:hypothetical protein